MSLRAFHLLFIALSVILAAYVAAWAFGQYQTGHQALYVLAGIGAVVFGGGLALYGARFQRKTRNLRVVAAVAAVMAFPRAALACPVCFGQNDSPMASATNLGILAMLVVVAGVLAGFGSFIIYLNRRAKIAGTMLGEESGKC